MADKSKLYLCGITLCNIQNYKEPTFIPFSKKLTIIKASNNNTGKSTILKAMSVFRQEPTESTLVGLLRYKKDSNGNIIDKAMQGSITIPLSNGNKMYAQLDRVTIKSSKRETVKIIYVLYDVNNNIIKRWDTYSSEITRYLGWVTLSIDGETYPLNFKESGNHLFINTSEKMDSEALANLCYIEEIEIKLFNLRNAIERLTNTHKFISGDLAYMKSMLNQSEYVDVELLKYQKEMLVTYKQKVNELKYRLDIFKQISKTLELSQENKILKDLENLISLRMNKSKANNLSNLLLNSQLNQKANSLIEAKVSIKSISNIETKLQVLDSSTNLATVSTLTNNVTKINLIKNNINRLENIINARELYFKLNNILRYKQMTSITYRLEKLDKESELLHKIANLNPILEIENNVKNLRDSLESSSTLWILEKLKSLETLKNTLNITVLQMQKMAVLESLARIVVAKQTVSKVSVLGKSLINEAFLQLTKQHLNKVIQVSEISQLLKETDENSKLVDKLYEIKSLIPICPTCGQIYKGEDKC